MQCASLNYRFRVVALLAALVLILPPVQSQGAFYSGNDMKEKCDQKDVSAFDSGLCLGYFLGVFDSQEPMKLYCLPENVDARQIVDVIQQFLVRNPQDRHLIASGLAARALHEAFPCLP